MRSSKVVVRKSKFFCINYIVDDQIQNGQVIVLTIDNIFTSYKMRKSIYIFIALSFICGASFSQLSGDSFGETKSKGQGAITFTYANSPGYVYEGDDGEIQGISVDVMDKFIEYVQDKHKITLKVNHVNKDNKNFKLFLDRVQNSSKGVFGVSSTMVSSERKKVLKFSPAYHTTFSMIVTHKDVPSLKSIQSIATTFEGRKAYLCKSTAWEKQLLNIKKQYFPKMSTAYIESYQDLPKAVAEDKNSFTIINLNYFLMAVREGTPLKQHSYEKPKHTDIGIIMPLNSDWEPVITDFMNSGFIGSTDYKKIIAEHLGMSALKLLKQ